MHPNNRKDWSLRLAASRLRTLYHHAEHDALGKAKPATTGEEVSLRFRDIISAEAGGVQIIFKKPGSSGSIGTVSRPQLTMDVHANCT